MAGLPSGTVTFLFTDLEGSTRLWEEHPDAMRDALARHDGCCVKPLLPRAVGWSRSRASRRGFPAGRAISSLQ